MSLPHRNSALHIAAMNNRLDEIRRLLKLAETDCDILDHHGETPLIVSLKYRCSDELVSLLIDYGCNVNLPNGNGVTPLHLAVQRRNPLIVSKLIQKGADINAKSKHHDCTPLHVAVTQGRYYNIRELLKVNGTVFLNAKNDVGQTPLVYGLCKQSGDKIISTLIDYGCDITIPDNKGLTSLHYASNRKSTFIARKLIEKGANIDFAIKPHYITPLHFGVRVQNLEYVCMLLYYGASVNEIDHAGRTPFHYALGLRYENIAQHLVNYIADFNLEDQYDGTYLHIALDNRLDIVMDLLDKCDINHLSLGEHCLYTVCLAGNSYEILRAIWSKTDFDAFVSSLDDIDFLNMWQYSNLPDDLFLELLYIVFDSSYIEDFLSRREAFKPSRSVINVVFDDYNGNRARSRFTSKELRLEIILVLLSYGVQVYFEDICYLYETYGFDESVELLLTIGCHIYPSAYNNLIVSRICYDNIEIYMVNQENSSNHRKRLKGIFDDNVLESYGKFYRIMFGRDWNDTILIHGVSELGTIHSLLQLSRDVIRKVIYRNCNTTYSFTAHEAMTRLPVPIMVKDILFLRRPIYEY